MVIRGYSSIKGGIWIRGEKGNFWEVLKIWLWCLFKFIRNIRVVYYWSECKIDEKIEFIIWIDVEKK